MELIIGIYRGEGRRGPKPSVEKLLFSGTAHFLMCRKRQHLAVMLLCRYHQIAVDREPGFVVRSL